MKSVLITGVSRGLGYELLKIYLENNWKVYALARNIKNISSLISKYPNHCFPVEGDITENSISEKIRFSIESNTKILDLLINNAGNAKKCFGIENVTTELIEDHFKVHVSSVFRVIKACLPFLIKSNNPVIINVSSRKGSIHKINTGEYRILIPYQVAKAAQNMLTACLNQELRETQIKTYAIHPGNLKTDVAPPDANILPEDAAIQIYQWILNCRELPTDFFYNISDNSILEW